MARAPEPPPTPRPAYREPRWVRRFDRYVVPILTMVTTNLVLMKLLAGDVWLLWWQIMVAYSCVAGAGLAVLFLSDALARLRRGREIR